MVQEEAYVAGTLYIFQSISWYEKCNLTNKIDHGFCLWLPKWPEEAGSCNKDKISFWQHFETNSCNRSEFLSRSTLFWWFQYWKQVGNFQPLWWFIFVFLSQGEKVFQNRILTPGEMYFIIGIGLEPSEITVFWNWTRIFWGHCIICSPWTQTTSETKLGVWLDTTGSEESTHLSSCLTQNVQEWHGMRDEPSAFACCLTGRCWI